MPDRLLVDERLALLEMAQDLAHDGLSREEIYRRLNGTGAGASREDAEEIAALCGAPPRLREAMAVDAPLTQMGNGQRLVAQHGDDMRYVADWGRWLLWDGRRWKEDGTEQHRERAKLTVRSLVEEGLKLQGDEREKMLRWAHSSQSVTQLRAILECARSESPIAAESDAFDQDAWLLNLENGTLDLRGGKLRFHRREDLLRKLAPVSYDPDAACPLWMSFLRRILGEDEELIQFLQRAVGYSLTGDVSEQVLFFLHGSGKNGKSTFLKTVAAVLGEYSGASAPDLLLEQRGESHPTALADLQGVRLVIASEAQEGKRMAESLVKQITGGDRIKARRMRQDFYEFDPTHKLWLMANHRPVVRGADPGIWRRILLIPFEVTIPEEERDKHFDTKLLAELPGILRWALEGCLAWQRNGLQPPERVRAATEEYREEMDTLGEFFDECCETSNPYMVTGATELYNAYKQWAERTGEHVLSQTAFGRKLTDRGIGHDRNGPGRAKRRIGIVLRAGWTGWTSWDRSPD